MTDPTARSAVADAYVEQDIRTADPLSLVVRVYEITTGAVARARAAAAAGDAARKGRAVNRAARGLGLLRESLDMEAGGPIALNLDRVYEYLQRRLTLAHARNDLQAFDEISRLLGELSGAWRQAANRRREPAGAMR
jgi:flagellar protein FliS